MGDVSVGALDWVGLEDGEGDGKGDSVGAADGGMLLGFPEGDGDGNGLSVGLADGMGLDVGSVRTGEGDGAVVACFEVKPPNLELSPIKAALPQFSSFWRLLGPRRATMSSSPSLSAAWKFKELVLIARPIEARARS